MNKFKEKFLEILKNIFEKKNRMKLLFWFSLLLILIGAVGASSVQTSSGKVSVRDVTIPTQDGQWSVADLYKPDSATKANPAPVIIVVPGFQRGKETQASFSIELARRGYVVITLDPYAQGESSSSNQAASATTEGYGAYAWIDYIANTDTLNYIDKTKIGATGHSAGGNAVVKAAAKYGQKVADGLTETSILPSIYVSGYIRGLSNDWPTVYSNVGVSYAYYDEGAYQNKTRLLRDANNWLWDNILGYRVENADLRYAPESIELVNSGLTQNKEQPIDQVEIGYYYGSPYNNTLRVINNENIIHALQPYDSVTTAHMIEFFDYVFEWESNGIASDNQVWWFREIYTGMMLVGGLLFVLALGALLLNLKFFESIKHQIPERSHAQKPVDKVIFWSIFTISVIIAASIYIPLSKVAQTNSLFISAQTGILTWQFPQRMTNAVLLWAVANGIIGIGLFFLTYFLRGKKHGTTLEPLKTTGKEILKTLFLAIVLFSSFYMIDLICYTVLHVDFRFMFIVARPVMNMKLLLVWLMYVPFFFIFYFSNSLRVNCSMRPANWSEGLSNLIAVLGNTLGLIGILAVQYITFSSTGIVAYQAEWLYVNILFGLIPMMAILPLINRFFFNKTGRAYLGPMVSCMIFIMMTTLNTVVYFPI